MHDPDCRLLRAMLPAFAPLLNAHRSAYVVISWNTHQEVADALTKMGFTWEREERAGVGASRRQALAMARRAGEQYLHYCDFDRALHWAFHYPEEMARALATIPDHDFLVIGRTPRAFASHPACMVRTESIANDVFALRFGLAWDLCAAARGLSARAADLLLRESKVLGVGTEGEWPALILQEGKLRAGYVEVEGMEFETADRHPEEVAAAGGVEAWTARESESAENWTKRLGFAYAIANACLRPGDGSQPVHIY